MLVLVLESFSLHRFVVQKLNSHPQIRSGGEPFQGDQKSFGSFELLRDEMSRTFSNECAKHGATLSGFKWMTNQGHEVAPAKMNAWFNATGTRVIYLWRRNILREFVSKQLLKQEEIAHPHSEEQITLTKVTLKSKNLVRDLENILEMRRVTAAYYPLIPSVTVYYEDVIDTAEPYNATWSTILAFLGVPVRSLRTVQTVVVHANRPTLALVENLEDVRKSMLAVCNDRKKYPLYDVTCNELFTERIEEPRAPRRPPPENFGGPTMFGRKGGVPVAGRLKHIPPNVQKTPYAPAIA